MRLIDAEAFEEKIKSLIKWININLEEDRFSEGCKASLKDVLSTLKNFTPTIDAVPVVHCKDCKYWDNKDGIGWCDLNSFLYSGGDWNSFNEEDYCSHGERKKMELNELIEQVTEISDDINTLNIWTILFLTEYMEKNNGAK